MTLSKCAKNMEKINYLILFLIGCVEVCTFPSLNTSTKFSICKSLQQTLKGWNTDEFCLWLGEAGVYPEWAYREKKGLQESKRKFKALEKSLWVPLADVVVIKKFSDEILPWKILLKIPCLFFSNISLLKTF